MNKKMIFIALGAGLLTFIVMIATVWFLIPKEAPIAVPDPNQMAIAQQLEQEKEKGLQQDYIEEPTAKNTQSLLAEDGGSLQRNLSENQLKSLIFEVRENIKAYKEKLTDLQVREQRLQIAQATLRQDIQELSDLRTEMVSAVQTLRNEREKLEQSLIKIQRNEVANLQQLSASYDKMEPVSAGKILLTMSQGRNGSSDDAVKILYYMSERVKAEVLAAIAENEPAISAYYCSELKQVVEEE